MSQVNHSQTAYIIIVSERNEDAFQTLKNLQISKTESEKTMITEIFFGAEDGHITLSLREKKYYCVKTSDELFSILKSLEIDKRTKIYNTSSVDFADEYGFKNINDAHAIIDEAKHKYSETYSKVTKTTQLVCTEQHDND